MTDLRERVARAIAYAAGDDYAEDMPYWHKQADAAIAATKLEREVFILQGGRLISAMEPVPATTDGRPCCTLCETPLDIPGRPWTRSCGGDCLACMADAGDPECVEAMGGWQPIETAPRDGTRVWLYRPECPEDQRQATGWWHQSWSGDEAWWMDPADSEQSEPTHWQPLPTAPTPPAAAEEKAP